MAMHTVTGNIHIHSAYSDGTATFHEIAAAAARAGLDFIVITDHNHLRGLPEEGFINNVLVLCGSEINNRSHHYLALNIYTAIEPNDDDPQQVIDAVNSQGGLGFIAHPFEKGSPLVKDNIRFPWTNWDVSGFTGIEVWNWCSQWRDGISNIPLGLFYTYLHPTGPVKGPCPQAMALFDEITATRQAVAIAGSDAHNWPIRRGLIRRDIFPYEYLFNSANNRLLLHEPLSPEFPAAKEQIISALRRGRSYIANERAGDPAGFSFTVTANDKEYHIGDTVPFTEMTVLHTKCPAVADRLRLRIIRSGTLLDEVDRCNLAVRLYEPGTYRIEVYRGKKPWIFTNPVYILP